MARGQLAQMYDEVASRVERAARRLRPPGWFRAAPRGFLLGARRPSRLPPWPALEASDHSCSGPHSAPATLRRRDHQRTAEGETTNQEDEPWQRRDVATLYATPLSSRRVRPESEWHASPLSAWDSAPPRRHRSQLTLRSVSPSLSNDAGWSRSQELRRPYLGWRSQEKLNRRPWTPEERLAASLLQQRASAAEAKASPASSSTPVAAPKQANPPKDADTTAANSICTEATKQRPLHQKLGSRPQQHMPVPDTEGRYQSSTPSADSKQTSPRKSVSNNIYTDVTKQGPPDECQNGKLLQQQVLRFDAPHILQSTSTSPMPTQLTDTDSSASENLYEEVTNSWVPNEQFDSILLQNKVTALDVQRTSHSIPSPPAPLQLAQSTSTSAGFEQPIDNSLYEDVTTLWTPNEEVGDRTLQQQLPSAAEIQKTSVQSEQISSPVAQKLPQPSTTLPESETTTDTNSPASNIYAEVIRRKSKAAPPSEEKPLDVKTYYQSVRAETTPPSHKELSRTENAAADYIRQKNLDVPHQSHKNHNIDNKSFVTLLNITPHRQRDSTKNYSIPMETVEIVSVGNNSAIEGALRDSPRIETSVVENPYFNNSASDRDGSGFFEKKGEVGNFKNQGVRTPTKPNRNRLKSPSDVRQNQEEVLYTLPVQIKALSVTTHHTNNNTKISPNTSKHLPHTDVLSNYSVEEVVVAETPTFTSTPYKKEPFPSNHSQKTQNINTPPQLIRSRTFCIEPTSEGKIEDFKVKQSSPVAMHTRSLEITLPQRITTNDTSQKLSVEERFWVASDDQVTKNRESVANVNNYLTPLVETGTVSITHDGKSYLESPVHTNREPFVITQLPPVELSVQPVGAVSTIITAENTGHTDISVPNEDSVASSQVLHSPDGFPSLQRSGTFCIDSHHSSLKATSTSITLPVADQIYTKHDIFLNKNSPLVERVTSRNEILPPSLTPATETSQNSSPLVETSLMTIQMAPPSPVSEYTAVYHESSPLLGRKPFTTNHASDVDHKRPLSKIKVQENFAAIAPVSENSTQSQVRSKIPVPTQSKSTSEKNTVTFAPILSNHQVSSREEHSKGAVKQKSALRVGGVLRRPSYRVATSVELTPGLRKQPITSDFRSNSDTIIVSNPQTNTLSSNKKAPIPKPPRARNKESQASTPTPPPRQRIASVPQTRSQSYKAVLPPRAPVSILTNGIPTPPYSALTAFHPKVNTSNVPVPNSRFHKKVVIEEAVSSAHQLPDPALLTPLKFKPCTTTDL